MSKLLGKTKGFFQKIGKFIKGHKLLCIILVILIAAGAFLGKKFLVKAEPKEAEEQQVMTTAVEVMDLQSSISVTGTLEAGQTQSVTSTVATGTEVAAVYYEVGDYVEEGTVIVEFDSDDYAEKLAELNAKYNISDIEDAHTLEDYLQQIEDKQAEMTEIQEYLDEWADVYNNLVDAYNDYLEYGSSDSTIASRWSTESSAAKALDDGNGVSISGYESKQEELETIQDEIDELQYKYELEVLNQEYDDTYTKSDEYDSITESQSGTQVVAPFSGYITAINVEEGNNYTQGNTVFTISNTDSFVVEATVDEYDIASLSEGLSAVVKFDATDDEEFTGTVSYVAVTSDSSTSSSSSTGTGSSSSSSSSSASYEVKITLDGADDRLRVGMTAKASVILEEATDAYAVAYDCVETDSDGNSYVTAVDDEGNETKITVTLGLESDYYVQIISDEITEGMLVKATASSASSSSDDKMQQDNSLLNLGGGQGGGDMGGGQGGAPGGGQGGPGGGF
ncbi:MAG: efflux RND transporter periplasmic adaptor subunit [Pseudobutyrivibrio sp.]|nr:efflux RND transporter periplasmic adaptor subunit [Pseudobutyrivibrio sp.]